MKTFIASRSIFADCKIFVALAMSCVSLICGQARGGATPIVRNLVTDYGAGQGANSRDISDLLQKAVDDVGAAGGGTVLIPARVDNWMLSRPVLVGYPNVTLAGEGSGTRINGGGTLFLLGLKHVHGKKFEAEGFPSITGKDTGILDESVTTPRFGLRTFDGHTHASGYFPACPLAFGYKVPNDPSGDYWKDYERGSGKATYWRNWPQYTINLAVRNNSTMAIKGTVCGVGAGGLSPELTKGTIEDPLTVWTIESDAGDGKNLSFKFKVTDKTGRESIRSLLLSKEPAGEGTHRISIQLDFTTGRCRAWYSASAEKISQPVLSDKLDLGSGVQLKAFEYGAFQLGAVSGRMFNGTPGDGDWTYSGLSLFAAPRYAVDGDADHIGAIQQRAGRGPAVNDTYHYFPPNDDKQVVTFLPLTAAPTDLLCVYQMGHEYGGESRGFGFWTPQRAPEAITGMITLRDMQLFSNSSNVGTTIGVGEASHVILENIYEGGGGFQGVAGLPISGMDRSLDLTNCRIIGSDTSLFAYDQKIDCQNITGGAGETMFRLVGCHGRVDGVIVTGFVACDYYVKLHAGQHGGPMRISQFCIDNEGISWAPKIACFYAELSPDGGANGNLLSFPGTIYTGSLLANQAVIELADPPGGAKASGVLQIDGVDLGVDARKPARCIVLSHSSQWSGSIRLAQTPWAGMLTHGLIETTAPGLCKIVSYHDDAAALPKVGTWLEGCHIFHIPERTDPATGTTSFTTYHCTRSGTYGTPREPLWEQAK